MDVNENMSSEELEWKNLGYKIAYLNKLYIFQVDGIQKGSEKILMVMASEYQK